MECCNKKQTFSNNTNCGNQWFLIILVLFILIAVMFGGYGW